MCWSECWSVVQECSVGTELLDRHNSVGSVQECSCVRACVRACARACLQAAVYTDQATRTYNSAAELSAERFVPSFLLRSRHMQTAIAEGPGRSECARRRVSPRPRRCRPFARASRAVTVGMLRKEKNTSVLGPLPHQVPCHAYGDI